MDMNEDGVPYGVYKLEDLVAEYIIYQSKQIVNDLHEFIKQFTIVLEVEENGEEEPLVDFAALEEWLRKETDTDG